MPCSSETSVSARYGSKKPLRSFIVSDGFSDEPRRGGFRRDDFDKKSTASVETNGQVQKVDRGHGDGRQRGQGAWLSAFKCLLYWRNEYMRKNRNLIVDIDRESPQCLHDSTNVNWSISLIPHIFRAVKKISPRCKLYVLLYSHFGPLQLHTQHSLFEYYNLYDKN